LSVPFVQELFRVSRGPLVSSTSILGDSSSGFRPNFIQRQDPLVGGFGFLASVFPSISQILAGKCPRNTPSCDQPRRNRESPFEVLEMNKPSLKTDCPATTSSLFASPRCSASFALLSEKKNPWLTRPGFLQRISRSRSPRFCGGQESGGNSPRRLTGDGGVAWRLARSFHCCKSENLLGVVVTMRLLLSPRN